MKRRRHYPAPWIVTAVRREIAYRLAHGVWKWGDGRKIAAAFGVSTLSVHRWYAAAVDERRPA